MQLLPRYMLEASLLVAGFLTWLGSAKDGKVVVTSIGDDLNYDENGKLLRHHLFYPMLGPDDRPCPAAHAEAPHGFEYTPLAGDALRAVFPDHTTLEGSKCPVACAERGTDRSVAHAIMPHKTHRDLSEEEEFEEWVALHCGMVDVCLMNHWNPATDIIVYWISPDGDREHQVDVEYGGETTQCFRSLIGHAFEALDGTTNEVIDSFTVEYALFRVFGNTPPSCDLSTHQDFEDEIQATLKDEWDRHKLVQRKFTPQGFQKGRLPDDVFASMGAFHYNNRHNYALEEWCGSGVYVNWWEADCYIIEVPAALKAVWQDRLKELVEVWAGVEVEQTDMYGMRRYAQGARLLTHVDRVTTHAVSMIVNIAQGNLSKPWPVEINDHQNRLHEYTLEPGEILYYESAACLHGRNRPLAGDGSYFVNLFTHYRPIGDPEWYLKPNPAMTGQCHSKMGATDASEPQCQDPGVDTSSPEADSLFRATSGEDLIRWRRLTGE